MEKIEQLKDLIAIYWQMTAEAVDWDTAFSSQHLKQFSSLRALRFLASVEDRFQVTIEDPEAIRSFRDLFNLVTDA